MSGAKDTPNGNLSFLPYLLVCTGVAISDNYSEMNTQPTSNT